MATAINNNQLVYDIGDKRYINLTDRCTLSCQFCPKFSPVFEDQPHQLHEYDLTLSVRPEVDEIIQQLGDPKQIADYDQFVFCGYGEPTLRLKPLLEIARYIKSHGGTVRINTDGLGNLANKRNILPELAECIDALSVSLNAQNEDIYKQHCVPALDGSYQALLDFLKLAPDYIADTTATAIHGLEGVDVEACEQIAIQCGVKFRKRELDAVG